MGSAEAAALASLALFAGGAVKGLTGLGLPLIAVPFLAYVIGLRDAIQIIVIPIALSNLTQIFQGGRFPMVLRRFWTLLVPLVVGLIVSANVMVRLPERALDLVLGLSLLVVPPALHFGRRFRVRPEQERWLSPFTGAVSGALGGLSTIYGPPIMLYLRALGLEKTEFVAAISLLYFVGALAIVVGVYGSGETSLRTLELSCAACIPMFAGMWLGQRIHVRLSERHFAQVLLVTLSVIGASFVLRAL